MATEYKIMPSKLENLPTIDGQCCVNLTAMRNVPTTSTAYPKCCQNASGRVKGTLYKSCKLVYLSEILLAIFVLCFAAALIYVTITLGYFQQPQRIDEAVQLEPSVITTDPWNTISLETEPLDIDLQSLFELIDKEDLEALAPQIDKLLNVKQNRSKRDAEAPCKQDREHCKTVMESMMKIVNIVNNSMPYLQSLLSKGSESKSELKELVECLQCKNDSFVFIDESGPESVPDYYRDIYHHPGQAQMEHNFNVVTNLLNDKPPNPSNYENQKVVRPSADSIFYEDDGLIMKSLLGPATDKIEAAKPAQETGPDNAVAIQSANNKTKEDAASGIDNVEQTVDVTNASDSGNVMEIKNQLVVHPSVHPSDQGHAEPNDNGQEAGSAAKGPQLPYVRELNKARIVSNDRYQAKGSQDYPSVIMPTAETMKSTQQLQLTPTMSWMPYQVCFDGPQPNGGPGKPFTPGQIMYPATAPGSPYPMTMPQQRMGPQSSGPAPNVVQVQAHSVQFMQPGTGNQRMGPTGPAMPNFMTFPGQMTPSAATRGAEKSPYYCTYIPVPTFQFPTIPGVSEYQRSSDGYGKKDNVNGDGVDHGFDGQRSLVPDYSTMCPTDTLRCKDGRRCILRSEWCDGQVDCNDASDEISCSCRDRISKERLCDGYFDCPHGEDELGCLGCSKTTFSCNDWRSRYSPENCVPLSQRCDGIKQCPNGKDEIDCNILTPSFTEGKNMFTIGYTEGYLHKNYMGQWYPVCAPEESWTKDACSSEIGSEVTETPKIQMQHIQSNAYRGPYIVEVNGQIKLIPSCMNTAVYVRCPQFPCGTRVPATQDLLPQILDNEDQSISQTLNNVIDYNFRSKSEAQTEVDDNDDANKILGSQLRVVGGRASRPNAWPFLVAIYKDGRFYCGGVILNELWIITAAHCLEGYPGHFFEIQAGLLRQFSFAPMAQSRKARYIVLHPWYNELDMSNDIAMIKLDDPLRFNRWVRPVCLPDEDLLGAMWRRQPEVNTTCIATGWGATQEHGPDPDHLREVEVPIMKSCKYEIDLNENVICAGYPQGGRDACQGDSGGPLMCKNPYRESQWYVAGIVSHGEGCARPDEPGVYTRVSHYRNWIRETSSDPGLPPLARTLLMKCPGFSCNGGLGRCLPIEARCNGLVECLDGEDEKLCRGKMTYPPQRQLNDPAEDNQFAEPAKATISEETTTSEGSTTSEGTATSEKTITSEGTTTFERTTASETTSPTIVSQVTDATTQTSTEDQTTDPEPPTSTTEYFNYANTESSTTSALPPTTFTCSKMLQTITIDKRCDRVADCEDSTDELNCTCKDFLVKIKPSAICDGYVDCDDKSDEKDCEICSQDEFYCRVTKKCINGAKKCDGKFDCPFLEDEQDCLTLSNGHRVYLDADERPSLQMQGIVTRNVNGKWRPSCLTTRMHQNQSTVMFIAKNMCRFFGFADMESAEAVIVRNSELETISWNKKNFASQESPSAASLSDDDKTCPGIKIRCRPVLHAGESTYLIPDAGTGSRGYLWPWVAAIFVDGSYRCSAILLDDSWLLSASKCTENVRLDTNYTTAVLGYGPFFRYVDGPHQQVTVIDELQHVNDSVSVLLHLKRPVKFNRYAQPLFVEKTIYLPGSNDTCRAVGTNKDHETKSISLRPVLKNCQNCQRCFVNASINQCPENETSEWSGTIFCHGKKGWYPAAAFEDNGPCDFRNTQTLTSIDHINPYLTEALDNARLSTEASCDGFRCSLGQCIPESQVCDGIPDCRDQADEDPEYCGKIRENCDNNVDGCHCLKSELRCRNGKCVDKSAFCDGIVDCEDSSDEPNICTCAEYLRLTNPERLCDGVRHCLDKTDELPEICPCTDSSFQCMTSSGIDTCIPQDFVCDGDADCISAEDESNCRRFATSPSNGTSEIIHRTYGVWHTACFEDQIASQKEANDLCKGLGYSYGVVKNDTMPTDKPMIPHRDSFYMVKLNDFKWMTLRDDKPLVTLVEAGENCNRAFVTCV